MHIYYPDMLMMNGSKMSFEEKISVLREQLASADAVVIGAGSVVTKDIPDNVCAAGNPCRVIREIADADKPYYFKDRKFDEEAWAKINEK